MQEVKLKIGNRLVGFLEDWERNLGLTGRAFSSSE